MQMWCLGFILPYIYIYIIALHTHFINYYSDKAPVQILSQICSDLWEYFNEITSKATLHICFLGYQRVVVNVEDNVIQVTSSVMSIQVVRCQEQRRVWELWKSSSPDGWHLTWSSLTITFWLG